MRTESAWRASIGRSYYAAFHVARALLVTGGVVVPRDAAAHKLICQCLRNCGLVEVVETGNRLDDLRRKRDEADYDLLASVSQPKAALHYMMASNIMRVLEAAAQSGQPDRIGRAVRLYLQSTNRGP